MVFRTPKQTPELQYALAIVLAIAPTIFTALRFRVRVVRRVQLDWDDWLVVVALFFVYLTSTFLVIGTALGYQGRHMRFTEQGAPVLTDEGYIWLLRMLYAGQLSQIFAIGPTKISVVLFYRRIFRGFWFHFATLILIGLVSAWMIALFFANLLECIPITDAFVNAPGMGGNPHCIDAIPMYLAQVYSDVILDILILVLPIPFVWQLHLPRKQKLGVIGIFLLGIITVLSSCAKMIIFNYVGHELQQQADISYFRTPIAYWPLIEACLQIIAACLTMMRPLVEDWRLIYRSGGKQGATGYFKSLESENHTGRTLTTTDNGRIVKRIDLKQEIEMDVFAPHSC